MNKTSQPTVTVAIPTYRGAAYLSEAIGSVLRQSFTDFELVVIDDNSPDNTQEIVAAFKDPRLIYLRNPANLGPQGNWNRCLEVARGKYFKLLPHDDLLQTDCLKRQVQVLEADDKQHIALVFSARDVVGPQGNVLMQRGYPGAKEGPVASQDVLRTCVRRGTNVIGEPGAVLFRKALADRVGAFDGSNPYVIDLDYWFRLLAHGEAWYSTESLATFRVSPQQWSVVIGDAQSKDFLSFLRRIKPRLDFKLGLVDVTSARVMSTMNNVMRIFFYKIFLK